MKEKSPCRESNSDLFGPNGYFQISWTPTKNGTKSKLVRDGKLQKPAKIGQFLSNISSVASVAQRKWTRPKTMRPRVRIPVKNFELWKCVFQLEKQFPIVFIALRGPEPAPTSSDICERHMLVTWYQNGWRSNHNVGLRMLLVNGAGSTPELAGEAYNSWNSHKRFKRYKTCKE